MTGRALDKIEAAADRLDNYIASLVGFTTLPDSIHVAALREGLPTVSADLRSALAEASEPPVDEWDKAIRSAAELCEQCSEVSLADQIRALRPTQTLPPHHGGTP
jgi:hypothetical protein